MTEPWQTRALRPIPCLALATLIAACGTAAPESDGSGDSTATDTATSADTGTAAHNANAPQPGPLLLTPDGWGPLRIGMTRAAVVAAAGEDSQPDAVGGPEPERCDEFRPLDATDVLVMIEDGVLTRISVSRNTDIATPAGFRVGDAGADIVAGYGARADVTPHKYLQAPARYITVWNGQVADSERRGIRYETDVEDVVAFIRGGGASIEYVEGCL